MPLPANADEVCKRSFFCLVHLMKDYDILGNVNTLMPLSLRPSFYLISLLQLVIGMDQLGNYVWADTKTTFDQKGKRQINITVLDKKHAYTLLVATTPAGDALPFQQVWSGATMRSLPKATAEGMSEACKLSIHFAFAQSEKKTQSLQHIENERSRLYLLCWRRKLLNI